MGDAHEFAVGLDELRHGIVDAIHGLHGDKGAAAGDARAENGSKYEQITQHRPALDSSAPSQQASMNEE